jgi:DNA topoisomerase-1
MIEEKPSEQRCPACGKVMVYRRGRFGPFLGCSDYPKCKSTLKLDKSGKALPPAPPPQPTGVKCYKCKEGQLLKRQSKRGSFLGCSRFPKCRTIISAKKLKLLKQLQSEGKWPPETILQANQILGRKRAKKTKKTKVKSAGK